MCTLFSRYSLLQPIYINVVRDPIERTISHYYYNIYGSYSQYEESKNSEKNIQPTPNNNRSMQVGHFINMHGNYVH